MENLKNYKILITGNGFVSKHLQKHLSNNNLFIFNRNSTIKEVKDFSPDIIFHTAADLTDERKMFDSNIRLTYDLLECTKGIDYESFIYIGSSSEYGEVSGCIKETDRINPRTMYEGTKGCGSLLCQSYARTYKKPIVIARPFSLYGDMDVERKLIPIILKSFKEGIPLKLVEDSVHDWLYINDFIRGLLTVAFSDDCIIGDIINFGTGVQSSNLDILKLFEKIFKKSISYEKINKIRSYDNNISWICDTTYAANQYGFKYKYSLEEGLFDYVRLRSS